MFSGEIGSLQPRTSYAVARTIGSREMGCTRLHDASIKTTTFAAHLSWASSRIWQVYSSELPRSPVWWCEPGWCWRLGDRFKQSRSIIGHAIDRGRNFVGFEEIFARPREQRSGDHRVHVGAVEPEVEDLERQDHRHGVVDGMQHTRRKASRFVAGDADVDTLDGLDI